MSLTDKWLTTQNKIAIARMLCRITTPFLGKGPRRIVRHGIRYEVDIGEGIDLSLFLFGHFQKHIVANKYISIPPNGTVIDVGANFGVLSLQFADLLPNGRVYSFEPTAYALEKFKRNLSLNPRLSERITVNNVFVGSRTDSETDMRAYSSWRVDSRSLNNAPLHPIHLGADMTTKNVGMVALDDFCKEFQRLDLIKIDTDGHEPDVLTGAQNIILRLRPKIIFEIGQYLMKEGNVEFDFYFSYFSKLNYKLYDPSSGVEINLGNYRSVIPSLGSIDLIALPRS